LSLPDELLIAFGALLKIDDWMRVRRTCVRLHAVLSCAPSEVCERWSSERITGFKAQTLRQVRLAHLLDWNAKEDAKFVPCKEPPPEVLVVGSLQWMPLPTPLASLRMVLGDGREGFGAVISYQYDEDDDDYLYPVRLCDGRVTCGVNRFLCHYTEDSMYGYNPLIGSLEVVVWNLDEEARLRLMRLNWENGGWITQIFHPRVSNPSTLESSGADGHHSWVELGRCAQPGLFLLYKNDPVDVLCFSIWRLGTDEQGAVTCLPLDERFQHKDSLELVLGSDGTLYLWDGERPNDVVCYRV
jgi:hypothetical protein